MDTDMCRDTWRENPAMGKGKHAEIGKNRVSRRENDSSWVAKATQWAWAIAQLLTPVGSSANSARTTGVGD